MKRGVVTLLVAGLLCGCSHTQVQSEWKDPAYRGPAVNSVMVLCLPADSKEKECEDDFTAEFRKKGIKAVTGYSTATAAASRRSAMSKAREIGVSRLLVSRFVKKETEIEAFPADDMMMPDYDMWTDYQYVESQYQIFATVLYDTATEKAIWAAESDTFVRPSEKKNMTSYVKAMVKKMEHQGLVAP